MSARSLAGSGMSAAVCGTLCLSSAGAAAAEGETAITIYSSAQPGAVPAEYYRPLPGRGGTPRSRRSITRRFATRPPGRRVRGAQFGGTAELVGQTASLVGFLPT